MQDFWRGFKTGFQMIGHFVASFINVILLTFVYFFGIGLSSFLGKLKGEKFLEFEIKKEDRSYWTDLKITPRPMDVFFRQF